MVASHLNGDPESSDPAVFPCQKTHGGIWTERFIRARIAVSSGGEWKMNIKLFGSLRAVLIVALVIMAASVELHAIDANNRYFAYGIGQRNCEDFVKFREKRLESLEQQHPRYTKDELYEIVDRIVEQWLAGFLTAHNLYVSDTYDLAGKRTMDELKTRLEKSCRANNKQYFVEAVIALVQELHPQRVKADAGK